MPQNNSIGYSPDVDIPAVNIADRAPERMIRVYPYELINSKNSQGFIAPQTVSIATISQENFDGETGMKQDKHGNWYFEALPDVQLQAKLDTSTATSTAVKLFKEEVQFKLQSNSYYESGMERIAIGNTYFNPSVFTIGAPLQLNFVNNPNYTPAWYENLGGIFEEVTDEITLGKLGNGSDGEMKDELFNKTTDEEDMKYIFFDEAGQEVYIATTTLAAAEYNNNPDILNGEGLYEIQFANLAVLTTSYPNSVVKFVWHNLEFKDGIHIKIDKASLIGRISARGDIKIAHATHKNVNIDLHAGKLTPIKSVPSFTKDKLTMYMNWFDYDNVMAYGNIKLFSSKAVGLSTIIKNSEDLSLVNDMILLSYMYATNFEKVPVIQKAGSDFGKIDPSYTITSKAIFVTKLVSKTSLEAVDGLYEAHIRANPTFMASKARRQKVGMVLNALCRYINSTYTVGKGNTGYGWAFLPWYLEPTTGIDIIKNNKNITLTPNLNFKAKSIYFNKAFTAQNVNEATYDIAVPSNVLISSPILLQTDKKLSLPDIPYNLAPLGTTSTMGDVNTKTDTALKYLWFTPLDTEEFKKLFLTNINGNRPLVKGDKFTQTYDYDDTNLVTVPMLTKWLHRDVPYAEPEAGWSTLGNKIINTPGRTHYKIVSVNMGAGTSDRLKLDNDNIFTFNWGFDIGRGGVKLDYLRGWKGKKIFWFKAGDIAGAKKVLSAAFEIPEDNFEIISSTLTWSIDEPFFGNSSIDFSGEVNFKLIQSKVLPIPMIVTKNMPNIKVATLLDRKLLYDASEWKMLLQNENITTNDVTEITLRPDGEIQKINEIMISAVFCSKLSLGYRNRNIDIPLLNKHDETISTQKIIFT